MKIWRFAAGVFFVCAAIIGHAATIEDAESASHGDAAANYQLVKDYSFDGCTLAQFKLAVLSHFSYILSSGKEALLIDPGRDIDVYREYLRKHGLTLKAVFLTHSHADFVAGHIEAAQALGVPVYISHAAQAGYPHQAIKDNDLLTVGKASIRFLETPGHTLDGVCAVVSVDGKEQFMLTGDTLFVGSVGRPDLMGGTISAAELAGKSFDSWQRKLSPLPDELKFFPAHGAGSLCGAHLKDEPFSTLGAEKRDNAYLQAKSRSEFIARVLDGLPEAPQYFKYDAAMNRQGPAPVAWNAPVEYVTNGKELDDPARNYVIDVRDAKSYAAGHILNSVNIALRGRFENWVGIMVKPEEKIVLAADHEADLIEGIHRLHRIGYRARGVLYPEAVKNGIQLKKSGLAAPADLYAKMQAGSAPVIVDVRLPNEWVGVRIGEIVNLPLNHLPELSVKLNPAEPVVTVCNSAFRSSLAVGLLERSGFQNVASVDGGTEAWINAGLPVYRNTVPYAPAAQPAGKAAQRLPIPDRITPESLQMMMRDLPNSFELVDLRSPADFAEFSLPGAQNVGLAELLEAPAWKNSQVPLVLIDRDGSIAMAAGGALSLLSNRPVKVLHGGLEAYWLVFGSGIKAAVPPTVPPQAAPAPAPTPKKTSPGC